MWTGVDSNLFRYETEGQSWEYDIYTGKASYKSQCKKCKHVKQPLKRQILTDFVLRLHDRSQGFGFFDTEYLFYTRKLFEESPYSITVTNPQITIT